MGTRSRNVGQPERSARQARLRARMSRCEFRSYVHRPIVVKTRASTLARAAPVAPPIPPLPSAAHPPVFETRIRTLLQFPLCKIVVRDGSRKMILRRKRLLLCKVVVKDGSRKMILLRKRLLFHPVRTQNCGFFSAHAPTRATQKISSVHLTPFRRVIRRLDIQPVARFLKLSECHQKHTPRTIGDYP